MRRHVALASLLSCLVASISASEARSPLPPHYSVHVFGCSFPIPLEYVLNTRERDHFLFMRIGDAPAGVIDISVTRPTWESYEHTVREAKRRKVGSLTVVEYKISPEHLGWETGDDQPVVVVDDGVTYVSVMGRDTALVDSMIDACVESIKLQK